MLMKILALRCVGIMPGGQYLPVSLMLLSLLFSKKEGKLNVETS